MTSDRVWSKTGPESYFPSIEKKYGKTISEWQDISHSCGRTRQMEIVSHLKEEFGMGQGQANALVGYTLQQDHAEF